MGAWVLHFDGLYEPRYTDRGIATYGFLVTHDGETLHEESGLVAGPGPLASANVAEFGALIQGLSWLAQQDRGACALHVRGDSRLVIETTAGRWRLTSARLLPLRDAAQALAAACRVESFEKVGRADNARADALSRSAYHRLVAEHPEWGLRAGARRVR